MDNTVSLYIENQPIDIDQFTEFDITYSFDDLTNPTKVTSAWSKTVKLPPTNHNNRVFQNLWRFDAIMSDDYVMNPLIKLRYELYVNGDLLLSGISKFNRVNVADKSYEITLYSGPIELLEIWDNKALSDINMNNLLYDQNDSSSGNLDHYVDRDTIFENNHAEDKNVRFQHLMYIPTYDGVNKEFDNDSVNNASITLPDGSTTSGTVNIPWELDGNQINDHRANYWRPIIRYKSIFNQGISQFLYDDNGNQLFNIPILTQRHFNIRNPLWENLWMTLDIPPVGISKTQTDYAKLGSTPYAPIQTDGIMQYGFQAINSITTGFLSASGQIDMSKIDGLININVPIKFQLRHTAIPSGYNSTGYLIQPNPDNTVPMEEILRVEFGILDVPNNIFYRFNYRRLGSEIRSYVPIYSKDDESRTVTPPFGPSTTIPGNSFMLGGLHNGYTNQFVSKRNFVSTFRGTLTINGAQDIPNARFASRLTFLNDISKNPVYLYEPRSSSMGGFNRLSGSLSVDFVFDGDKEYTNDIKFTYNYSSRSYSTRNYNSLINTGDTNEAMKFSDFILSYTKPFGIILDVPYNQPIGKPKNVNLHTRNSYFEDWKFVDWTSKLDYSKPITKTPIKFEQKFINFSWAPDDTGYLEEYRNKYGREYGSKTIDTGYQFNGDTTELLDDNKFKSCIFTCESDKFFYNKNADSNFDVSTKLYRDNVILPAFFKKNGSVREQSGGTHVLLFGSSENNRALTWDIPDGYYISDDRLSTIDTAQYTYNYIDTTNIPIVASYKTNNFDDLKWANKMNMTTRTYVVKDANGVPTDQYSLEFGIPAESYYEYQYAPGTNFPVLEDYAVIYSRYHRAYYEDRNNVNNSKIDAEFWLEPQDLINWKFNTFTYLENAQFHINKINFSAFFNRPAKVELIQVTNIENYIGNQHIVFDFISVNPNSGYAITADSQTMEVNVAVTDNQIEYQGVLSTAAWNMGVRFLDSSNNLWTGFGNSTIPLVVPQNTDPEQRMFGITFSQIGNASISMVATYYQMAKGQQQSRTINLTVDGTYVNAQQAASTKLYAVTLHRKRYVTAQELDIPVNSTANYAISHDSRYDLMLYTRSSLIRRGFQGDTTGIISCYPKVVTINQNDVRQQIDAATTIIDSTYPLSVNVRIEMEGTQRANCPSFRIIHIISPPPDGSRTYQYAYPALGRRWNTNVYDKLIMSNLKYNDDTYLTLGVRANFPMESVVDCPGHYYGTALNQTNVVPIISLSTTPTYQAVSYYIMTGGTSNRATTVLTGETIMNGQFVVELLEGDNDPYSISIDGSTWNNLHPGDQIYFESIGPNARNIQLKKTGSTTAVPFYIVESNYYTENWDSSGFVGQRYSTDVLSYKARFTTAKIYIIPENHFFID